VKPSSNGDRAELARFIKGFWLRFNEPPLLCIEVFEAAQKIRTGSAGFSAELP
jgi:hypothetical protein